MKITIVQYRQLESGPGFSNRAVEAAAEVGEGEDPQTVLNELRIWIEAQLQAHRSHAEMQSQRDALTWEVASLQRQKERLAADVEALGGQVKKLKSEGRAPATADNLPF